MFTGLVSAVGEIVSVEAGDVHRFAVRSPYDAAGIELGASISHAGACLTVTSVKANGEGAIHTVEVSPETLARTTLGSWMQGSKVNLERSLKMGGELGGHLVTGHVDGVGTVRAFAREGEWTRIDIAMPDALARFIAEKGSIAVDGVSLTVNTAGAETFSVMIIPHTASVTTLGALKAGDAVNLEVDLMARYAARLAQFEKAAK
ncbi:riboflavin synthase [Hyphobacterium sp. SN044]|uniref:riboflavin synthase n=1 Tax=Hyphobacterium sp. SN044 TaxID=2912575 RepID=UPI001F48DAF0|nr:riboflavin synthase [Hyphobacterium sp. SN044]MCF8878951.1 riboflavin synthase [Hyphobacterium sp. SN044]